MCMLKYNKKLGEYYIFEAVHYTLFYLLYAISIGFVITVGRWTPEKILDLLQKSWRPFNLEFINLQHI